MSIDKSIKDEQINYLINKIMNSTIPNSPDSINEDLIAPDAVTTTKISNDAITSEKIASNAVTKDKLSITPNDIGAANILHNHTTDDITNFPTSMPASDVFAWAKEATKPNYTASEVGADVSGAADIALTNAITYTNNKISALIDDAPETLDTLSEIATAINDNQTVIDTLNSAIGNKVNTSEVVTIATPNKVLKLDTSGKLPASITGNAATATTAITASNVTWSGVSDTPTSLSGYGITDAATSSNLTSHTTNKSNPHSVTKDQVGLGNVGNFKSVSTVADQGLTNTEKSNARTNIGAGTSSFSGSYNDLSNKPTIPTVNNAILTIQKNGTNVGTFTANASTAVTANITVPTKVSELTNDSGFKTTDNNTTYTLTQDSNDGHKITLTPSSGTPTVITIPDNNTTYNDATTSEHGLMTANMVTKLNGIATGANAYSLPTASASTLGGVKTGSNITNTSGVISLTKTNVTTALGYTPPTTNTTYSNATTSASGLMSETDKTKLDNIEAGANKIVKVSELENDSGFVPSDGTGATGTWNITANSANNVKVMSYIEFSAAGITPKKHYIPTVTDPMAEYRALSMTDAVYIHNKALYGAEWSGIINKPTTIDGYGITDAATSSHTHDYLPLTGGNLSGNLNSSGYFTTGSGFIADASTSSVLLNYIGEVVHTLILDYKNGDTKITASGRNLIIGGAEASGLYFKAGNQDAYAPLLIDGHHAKISSRIPGVTPGEGSAIEIREAGEVGDSQSDWTYAPKIGFHWDSRVSYTLGMDSGGVLRYINEDGVTGGAFAAGTVYGAVWNDYAEYRNQETPISAGYCVVEQDNGKLIKSSERLQKGGSIVSDTFGFSIGETDECKTPLAVSGRVLAYTFEPRYTFHAGDAVCTGPNGTISKMTDEEEEKYPLRCVGIVSEIPEYEVWGSGNVKVDGRIWIKVK